MEIPSEFKNIEHIEKLVSVPNPQDVNCHKAVLYLTDDISYSDLTSDSKLQREQGLDFSFDEKARDLSDKDFIKVRTVENVYQLADRECTEADIYVGQILDAVSNEMAHSFLLTHKDTDYICFDKAGFKKPFTTCFLNEFLNADNYQNQLWRFFKFSDAGQFTAQD